MWLPDVMISTPASNISSAVLGVSPLPPAAFSPLAMTRSMLWLRLKPGRTEARALRPTFPTTSPMTSMFTAGSHLLVREAATGPTLPPSGKLLRVLHRAPFADDGDLDLPRVVQVLLYLLADLLRHPVGAEVIDLFGLDDDAYLAAGLDGERLRDAGEGVRHRLQRLQPLQVLVHGLAPSARSAAADRVGDDGDDRLHGGRLDLLVVRLDAVDDAGVDVVAPGELRADRGVSALHVVVDRLAQVVKKAAAAGNLHVGAQLVGDYRRQVRRLYRVVELVLAVAVAVLQAAQRADNLGVQAGTAGLHGGFLSGLLDGDVHLLAGLLHHLLDARRVYPAVGEELGERHACDLPPHGVEAG